jgi:hypothetical protein
MTADLHEFLPEVQPEVMDAPLPLILQAIRDSAQRFCSGSWVWRETETFSLEPNKADYEVKPVADAKVAFAFDLRKRNEAGSSKYTTIPGPTSYFDLERFSVNWRNDESSVGYIRDWVFDDGVITIVPKPTAYLSEWVKVECVLQPDRTTNEVPEELFNDYAEEIGAGAKAKLMMMRDKKWTDMNLAKEYKNLFEKSIRRARWRFAGIKNPRAFHRTLGT